MQTVLMVALGVAMLSTLFVMLAGMVGIARNDGPGGGKSNRLMQWRVGLQALSLVLFVLLMLVSGR